jgi:hypothetical protein
MPSSVILPLSLSSNRNFQAFFSAIEDVSLQDAILKDKSTNQGVREVISLVRDKRFLRQAEGLVNLMRAQTDASRHWEGSFAAQTKKTNTVEPEQITAGAQAIKEYIQKKYPEGVKLLSEYGKLAQPAHLVADDTVGAWTNVAAYAEALVNAAVYANVAVATSVVVAAAAAAVIAAAVMVP